MKDKRYFILIILILIGFIFINTLIAQNEISTKINNVTIETEVLEMLNHSEWVSVIVSLFEENNTIRDIVLSNLSSSEFQFKEKLLRKDKFAGNITKEGLDKLVNNPNVEEIYLSRVGNVIAQDNETNYTANCSGNICVSEVGVEYEKIILDYFDNQILVQEVISRPVKSQANVLEIINNETWVSVIIRLKDKSQIDGLVSDFSKDELRNFAGPSEFSPEDITVSVNKKGFEKLINDDRIENVSYVYLAYLSGSKNLDNLTQIKIISFIILVLLIIYFLIKRMKNKQIKK